MMAKVMSMVRSQQEIGGLEILDFPGYLKIVGGRG
jgi:hypothetical protein